jgi:putative solute:sodium symporter small subunit
MDNSSNGYHISFFKPTTPQALANRNMVLWLISVWFIAIFGFQFLLWVIEKPTPQPAYLTFQNVWEHVEKENPNSVELQGLGQSTLSVLGKIAIAEDEKIVLDNALSWSVYQLTADSMRQDLVLKVQAFEKLKADIESISDLEYIAAKETLITEMSGLLNLSVMDVRAKITPLELSSKAMVTMTEGTRIALPSIMEKYLVHNQSFLTDWKFLGFPFHYFYTAVFLLILFIGLCLLYCVKTDQLNAKLNIVD